MTVTFISMGFHCSSQSQKWLKINVVVVFSVDRCLVREKNWQLEFVADRAFQGNVLGTQKSVRDFSVISGDFMWLWWFYGFWRDFPWFYIILCGVSCGVSFFWPCKKRTKVVAKALLKKKCNSLPWLETNEKLAIKAHKASANHYSHCGLTTETCAVQDALHMSNNW